MAWPKGKIRVGQKVHLQLVGRATSSSSGSYVIHPSVVLAKGIHNLEVLARSRVAAGAFSFSRKVARGGRALVAVDGSASTGPVTANIRMMRLPRSAWSSPRNPSDGPVCPAVARLNRGLGTHLVDVGGRYSLMIDGKMKMTYSAGSSTTIGVGISVPGDFGSFSAEGTFTVTSSGTETFPTLKGKIANEQTPYTFGEYGVCGMAQVQPEIWATGRNTVNVKPPDVGKCGFNVGPGGTFTRNTGTAGTFKVGVDLEKEIGISLSAQSGYNQDVSIKYMFPSEGGFMCGSNGLPSVAAWDLMSPCDNQGHCVVSSTASIRARARSRGASHPVGRTRR